MGERMIRKLRIGVLLLLTGLISVPGSSQERAFGTMTPAVKPRPAGDRLIPAVDPFEIVSSTSLLRYLEDLTSIEAHSGWRTCGSAGDEQTLNYLEQRLQSFAFLVDHGLEVERESYRTIAGVVFHRSLLEIEVEAIFREVPADAIAGHPYDLSRTRLYDSDGSLNDSSPNPVSAAGPVEVITELTELQLLAEGDLEGRIAVLDYALIDRMVAGSTEASNRAQLVFAARPLGLVAVTSDSLVVGESHGSFAGDSSILSNYQADPPIPVLIAQIEDMGVWGLASMADLETIASARMTWDTDIVSPGQSGNIVARIPGRNSDYATILSAHHDSPNCPGALDDGSGTASLLEVARVLNRSHTIPPVDVYLVWFGCEERGLFGSPFFASTHQELLDRALGMIEMDGLARSLNGLDNPVNIESWSYDRLGDPSLPFPDFLHDEAAERGDDSLTWDFHWLLSDISGFIPYDVPNALIDNLDFPAIDEIGSAHYTAHWHTPYDTVAHARAESEQFERLTAVMLSAALDTGSVLPDLRVTPAPSGRAVFVGSHTESPHMAPYLFTDLGTILAWEGLDVDLVPYGEALTAEHLVGAEIVVVLPVHDFPNLYSDLDLYDESWTGDEVEVLADYVGDGGLLVLTNAAARLGPFGRVREDNEDQDDINAVSEVFGIRFGGDLVASMATAVTGHPLMEGVEALRLIEGNGSSIAVDQTYSALARVGEALMAIHLEHGDAGGEVVGLGDLGILVSPGGQPTNFTFWQNLARYAATR